ncbi:MAG: transposase [Fulvivirga sp.]|uniref:transposase n=1 Tax=Fulvivirga sp. TaxID=1931237 RepID=UPI0032FAE923
MKRERQHFDKEYKLMAVKLCHTGKSPTQVAKELGIMPDLVRRWKREHEEYREGSFSGHGKSNMTAEEKEIAQLRKELKEAQLERDILKKAVSIFSKSDNKYSGS